MFERGKKDDGTDEAADFRSAAPQRKADQSKAGATNPNGECAVIGRSIEINGDVRGNEDLRIEGDVSGTVELRNSNLTIGREGKVRADVYAKSITVDGTTEGDLYASERIVVHISAHVRGNITAPKVGIEEGAKFKGSIEMDQDAVEKALGKANMKATIKASSERPAARPGEPKIAQKDLVKEAASGIGPQAGAR